MEFSESLGDQFENITQWMEANYMSMKGRHKNFSIWVPFMTFRLHLFLEDMKSELILRLRPANERNCYQVT